ncbi:phage portal protein [Ancylobacter pratisalsi]|uniref:Phage portal protein n=1 Tax=Ancylobacter pratisalsi TaxID=1745854 RepID=A0A6P1YT80_9HYPH|nr:phage portal protein [Ancylobacter pratisalsi]
MLRKAAAYLVRPFGLRDLGLPGRGEDALPAGESITADNVLALSTAWACVNLLAGTISALPIDLKMAGNGGAVEEAPDHPLQRVLRESPNADQTPIDFWEFMCISLELWGNAYARIERNGAKIISLVPIRPDLVTVRRTREGTLEYRWSEEGYSYVEPAERVFHVRGFGGDALGGMSTLAHGRNTFGVAQAIDRAARSTFRNGLHPTIAFKFGKFLSPEQRALVELDMVERYQGARNAGRPIRLEGDVGIEKLSINPEDAQMLESRAFSVEEICRIFGVPPFMVGHTVKSTSWGSGLEQQVLAFQKFTLRRRLKKIEQAIRKQLLSSDDKAKGVTVSFNLEALLRGDSSARAAFYTSMLGAGVMTINEVRALEGLAPVAGGDVPRMQVQNQPITNARGIGDNGGPLLDDETDQDEAA